MRELLLFFSLTNLLLPALTHGGDEGLEHVEHSRSIAIKLIAIFSILIAGILGVCLPTLGKWLPIVRPEKNFFYAIKAFAAGVILATGFIHILPDAFENLSSPCLNPGPWQDFPFAGFFAMLAAIGTLVVDSVEGGGDVIRHRVISQVLEVGIVVHSVIIGISLGASDSPTTIRPLVVALSFHQFFEGMGVGGCLAQAKFKIRSMITMIIFFSLTTPIGIVIDIGISSIYDENSPTTLIVEDILNSGAAGILIYMALVDLLAADFMNPKVQNNGNLQTIIHISLLLGAGLMSLLAKWA